MRTSKAHLMTER